MSKKKMMLHVVVGTPDWEPTKADIRRVAKMFSKAAASNDAGIVVTRPGIEVSQYEVRAGGGVRVTVKRKKK
jgi:hypothetical protein